MVRIRQSAWVALGTSSCADAERQGREKRVAIKMISIELQNCLNKEVDNDCDLLDEQFKEDDIGPAADNHGEDGQDRTHLERIVVN